MALAGCAKGYVSIDRQIEKDGDYQYYYDTKLGVEFTKNCFEKRLREWNPANVVTMEDTPKGWEANVYDRYNPVDPNNHYESVRIERIGNRIGMSVNKVFDRAYLDPPGLFEKGYKGCY